jgi:hypothetical protein
MALIALLEASFVGLLVQTLMRGMMLTLSLLERALALDLAIVPVATRLVGGAVVAMGTGVVNAPPIITGINFVVPETTLVIVEMTGCWFNWAVLDILLALDECPLEEVETGTVEDRDGVAPLEVDVLPDSFDDERPVVAAVDDLDAVFVDDRLLLWLPTSN